jgi:NADH-quinone oxidoreductase subunit J
VDLISPLILYTALVLGAVGVAIALPRRGVSPQIIGALVAGGAGGLVILVLSLRALQSGEGLPSPFFYIFSVIALGASLRVITHPKPVYAALFFILTILSTAGLFLILAAEFMAFALVIIYAGAILITYLFVIMLATQAPSEEDVGVLSEYDATSREPIAATVAGFLLLGVLTSMMFAGGGVDALPAPRGSAGTDAQIGYLPQKIERALIESGELGPRDALARGAGGEPIVDLEARTVAIESGGEVRSVALPADLGVGNVEEVGLSLLANHPGSIEIAGVILLMAMLGAVVLARMKVQADEEEKARQAERMHAIESGGSA